MGVGVGGWVWVVWWWGWCVCVCVWGGGGGGAEPLEVQPESLLVGISTRVCARPASHVLHSTPCPTRLFYPHLVSLAWLAALPPCLFLPTPSLVQILGLTASPVSKAGLQETYAALTALERNLDAKLVVLDEHDEELRVSGVHRKAIVRTEELGR